MIPSLASRVTAFFTKAPESKEAKFDKKCKLYGFPKAFILQSKLSKMLFDNHLAEHIAYFGNKHVVKVEHENLLFGFTHSRFIKDFPAEQLSNLDDLFFTAQKRKWSYRVTSRELGPHIEEKSFDKITLEEFRKDMAFYGQDKVLVLEHKTFLTVSELFERSVLKQDNEGSYFLDESFMMTDRGLMRVSHTECGILRLHFIKKTKANLDSLVFDVCLHTPNSDVFMDTNTHASFKIILPNGQYASFGFYPDKEINSLRLEDFGVRMESPDHYVYFKETQKRTYFVRYEIKSKENIDKFMGALDTFLNSTDKKVYQLFHGNCACLIKEFLQQVNSSCGAKKISTNYKASFVGSILNRIYLVITKIIMAIIEFFKFWSLRRLMAPIHLPRDLILHA